MSEELTLELSSKSFDGYQYVYSHESFTLNCKMKFGVYVPSIADQESVPLLIFLSDSNCAEQAFITKSGVQRLASKYGFIVVNPDISPRDGEIEETGYYIDATESPWSENYQMFSYINDEFYELVLSNFNVDVNRIGILGHVMGGHGALISFLKCSSQYKSVSALAPICDPTKSEEGRNTFKKLFGHDENLWKEYDVCALVSAYHGAMPYAPILIDQGADDNHKEFIRACTNASFPIQLREHVGYDHSYYFLMTFFEDHFKYHKNEFEHSD